MDIVRGVRKMVKSIFLQDGEEIFVDDEDYERVSQYFWIRNYDRNTPRVESTINGEVVKLKTFILGETAMQIYKNNDFTKKNLTRTENIWNYKGANFNSSSRYKGVKKKRGKYEVSIWKDGKSIYIGRFNKEDDAALAYNLAVDEYRDGKGYKNVIGIDNRVKKRDERRSIRRRRRSKRNVRGVYKEKYGFRSRIRYQNKVLNIISNKSKEKAALAYNKCALYLYRNDAILNDVPMTDELKEFIDNWEIPDKIKALKEGAENE